MPTLDSPEASLLVMAKAGSDLAIDQLVSKHWPEAYRVAVRILRSHEDAEEIAQDALWKAITHLSSFREDASFRTWLHRIVVNHSLMELRRKRSRPLDSPRSQSLDAQPSCIGRPRTPEELLLEAECRTVVEDALSRLPAFYSIALRLADREGRSTKEIADCMGLSKGAVKTRLHRGRAHLRREILRRASVRTFPELEANKRAQRSPRKPDLTVAA
ncbi:MAG TPA: sigma-70 family RNA polymerase sigma factor [Bryobacteraceae bacterium]|nr:sigma-70 family RNA polymerase sigma factor [Bryobacteraceae bacterium]